MRKTVQSVQVLIESGMGAECHWFPEDVSLSALSETFAAMANTEGGQVILGVSPRSGRIQGIQNTEAAIDAVFQAALLADPPLVLPLPILEAVGEKNVIRISIPHGLPHIYTVGGRYLGREGRHTAPIPAGLLRRKLIERGVVQFEARVPPEAVPGDLDPQLVSAYADAIRPMYDEETDQLLLRRGCLVLQSGRPVPTYAGLLLFGKQPQRWVSNSSILAARFSGPALSDVFLRQEIEGTLPQQLRKAEAFLLENMHSRVRMSGLTRQQSTEYPLEAVRELLVNAVAHRDYSNAGDSIHLHIFSNRLEVQSPGTLAGPVTLANLLEARFSRNPIIVQVLSDLGFIERLGYGLDRVVKVLAENRMQSPGFQETAGTFRVILSSARTGKTGPAIKPDMEEQFRQAGLNPRQERAIEFLLENERITNSDYQDLSPEVHVETLRRDLVDLVKRGMVMKIGSKRGTYYILK